MTPCTFLLDDNFEFKDGQKGTKIFVVLNNGFGGTYLAAKMTSNGRLFGITYGCQVQDRFSSYYLVKNSCFLNKCTWIQLDAFYEFRSDILIQKVMDNEIKQIGVLDVVLAKSLLSCASYSEDITISQEQMIQETLANLS